MPDYNEQWRAPTSRASGIAAAALANNANLLSSEINNATNLDSVLWGEISGTFAVAPAANTRIDVYVLYAADGTNYEEGGVGVNPIKALGPSITVVADTNAHRWFFSVDLLHPYKCKVLLRNNGTGQTMTVTLLLWTGGGKLASA